MSYKFRIGGGVVRVEDNACIPATTDNHDWVVYLAFVAAGGVTLPADPPPAADSAAAMLERQRDSALADLDTAITALPASQQAPLRLIQQLLKD